MSGQPNFCSSNHVSRAFTLELYIVHFFGIYESICLKPCLLFQNTYISQTCTLKSTLGSLNLISHLYWNVKMCAGKTDNILYYQASISYLNQISASKYINFNFKIMTKPQPRCLEQSSVLKAVANTFSSSTSETITTSASFELVSSQARVTSIKSQQH